MSLAAGVVALLAALGHAAICIYLNNRVHALGLPRRVVQFSSLLLHTLTVAGAAAWFGWLVSNAQAVERGSPSPLAAVWPAVEFWNAWPAPAWYYLIPCLLVALGPLPWSLWQRRNVRPPAQLLDCRSLGVIDVGQKLGVDLATRGWRGLLVRLPGNESLRLELNERQLLVPRLPAELDGLSVVHLSDLHFTGKIQRRYFEEVVEQANALQPDLVAITGDLLDKTACIEWVPYTLGRLRARHGAFFVLGNHDLRVDWRRLRLTLEDSGLIDLGGRWHELEINGHTVLLVGNELPWFKPEKKRGREPISAGLGSLSEHRTKEIGSRPLRIALSHSPDQLRWARRADVDLLLAGHNHGGQVRLPFIGPVLSPSLYGVRYACGTFFEPPTLVHVSRGVSGKTPLRYDCPPEVTKLVLCGAGCQPAVQ